MASRKANGISAGRRICERMLGTVAKMAKAKINAAKVLRLLTRCWKKTTLEMRKIQYILELHDIYYTVHLYYQKYMIRVACRWLPNGIPRTL